jgi:hypothetical protein
MQSQPFHPRERLSEGSGHKVLACLAAELKDHQPMAPRGRNRRLWGDGSFASIMKTINDGVPNPKDYRSPMPPKDGAQLSSDDVSAVTAYVWALGHQAAR